MSEDAVTLTVHGPQFLNPIYQIDATSIVWTERLIESGECRIEVNNDQAAELSGKDYTNLLLTFNHSTHVMLIESMTYEEGDKTPITMVITGKSWDHFLKKRVLLYRHNHNIIEYPVVITYADVKDILQGILIRHLKAGTADLWLNMNIQVAVDLNLPYTETSISAGASTVYDAISAIRKTYSIGIRGEVRNDASTSNNTKVVVTIYDGDDLSDSVKLTRSLGQFERMTCMTSTAEAYNGGIAFVTDVNGRTRIHQHHLNVSKEYDRTNQIIEIPYNADGTDYNPINHLELKVNASSTRTKFVEVQLTQEAAELYGSQLQVGNIVSAYTLPGYPTKMCVSEVVHTWDRANGYKRQPSLSSYMGGS